MWLLGVGAADEGFQLIDDGAAAGGDVVVGLTGEGSQLQPHGEQRFSVAVAEGEDDGAVAAGAAGVLIIERMLRERVQTEQEKKDVQEA